MDHRLAELVLGRSLEGHLLNTTGASHRHVDELRSDPSPSIALLNSRLSVRRVRISTMI